MREGFIHSKGLPQTMKNYGFSNPKGLKQILKERGLWDRGYDQKVVGVGCCARKVLAVKQDFCEKGSTTGGN